MNHKANFMNMFQFIYTFYPIKLVSLLYGMITLPLIILQWCLDPLYSMIVQGDDIKDADFCPVQIGFAVASGICLLSGLYGF